MKESDRVPTWSDGMRSRGREIKEGEVDEEEWDGRTNERCQIEGDYEDAEADKEHNS